MVIDIMASIKMVNNMELGDMIGVKVVIIKDNL
jgi:hypothetical protein